MAIEPQQPPPPASPPPRPPQRSRRRTAILAGGLMAALAAAAVILASILGAWQTGTQPPPIPSRPVASMHVLEASAPLTDASGQRWTPDPYSRGGSLLSEQVPISDTHSPSLYRSERVGIRSMQVPLASQGPHLVVLYFAETAGAKPGQRIFEVIANGRRIARLDIAAEVGALTPYHLAFTTRAPQHTLTIRFRAIKGEPILSAARVTQVNPSVHLPAHRPIFSDEFDGPRGSPPDPARWSHDLGRGWGQKARYTDAPANASLDGRGDLLLAALPDGSGGFTSARLTTRGAFAMGYGSASARIQVAGTPGVVSTFWALGADESAGWPYIGELDPAEVRGSQPKILVQAVHTHCGASACPIVWSRVASAPLSHGFHTFTVERAPGVLIYMLDGRQTASLTRSDLPRGSWAFDKRFHLLLNLIVGGWGGTPAPSAKWPIEMRVAWVRAFD